ncbi:MAG: hypothetical protein GXO48_02255 [Chlorobi bacterium]|nr:hypothetical protein [Chlorobiota bacterium]
MKKALFKAIEKAVIIFLVAIPLLPVFSQKSIEFFFRLPEGKVYRLRDLKNAHPDSVKILDLSYAKISTLPPEILKFKNIEAIILRKNPALKVKQVLRELAQLPKLWYLDLSWNRFTSLPDEVGLLTNLKVLKLNDNKAINHISDAICNVPLEAIHLKRTYMLDVENVFSTLSNCDGLLAIDLSFNQLFSIPANVKDLHSLEFLALNNNLITKLPPTLSDLPNLKWLNLRGNVWINAEQVFDALANSKSLETLIVSECDIKELPDNIGNLKPLKYLDLRSNNMVKVSGGLCELKNLEVLLLGYINFGERMNYLEKIPSCIRNLRKLRKLDLRGNKLEALPASVKKLTNMEHLDVSLNELTRFPAGISSMKKISYLNLGGNKFSQFPTAICRLTNLDTLIFDGFYFHPAKFKVKSLPSCIGNLEQLKVLSLNDQVIRNLPPSITNLSNLEELWVRNNLLKHLPEDIHELGNLRLMNLKANELEDLPETMPQLASLRILDISYNLPLDLQKVLPILIQMKQLELLDISYNPTITDELVKQLEEALPNTEVIAIPIDDYLRVPPPSWLQEKIMKKYQKIKR